MKFRLFGLPTKSSQLVEGEVKFILVWTFVAVAVVWSEISMGSRNLLLLNDNSEHWTCFRKKEKRDDVRRWRYKRNKMRELRLKKVNLHTFSHFFLWRMLCGGKMCENLQVSSSLIRSSSESASSVRDIILNFNFGFQHSGYLNLMARVMSRDLGIENRKKDQVSTHLKFEIFLFFSLFFHLISQSASQLYPEFNHLPKTTNKITWIPSTNPSLRDVVKNWTRTTFLRMRIITYIFVCVSLNSTEILGR